MERRHCRLHLQSVQLLYALALKRPFIRAKILPETILTV